MDQSAGGPPQNLRVVPAMRYTGAGGPLQAVQRRPSSTLRNSRSPCRAIRSCGFRRKPPTHSDLMPPGVLI